MGQIVKCDVCGKIYNQSHLSAHKRMSHGQREKLRSNKNEPASVAAIVSMYEQLPEEGKKEVLNRLLAGEGRPKS
ncbi:MAG: hypothetical protein DMG38_12025 [Acidobacteria bacterium]|nr:MAG: hypothetical protein DMG38_12025 [Acidobacteriota bacterium]